MKSFGAKHISASYNNPGHLQHEVGNHAVEGRALEAESLLAGAEGPEILCCLRKIIGKQAHHNPSCRLTANFNVKKYSVDHIPEAA